jgi:hypothetical protein
MHDHQEHRPRLQDRPVLDLAGPGALGPGRGGHLPAPAPDGVLVILGQARGHGGDLDLLERVHHTQIGSLGQVRATPARTLREPVLALVRGIRPGQVHPRRARLLALGPLRRGPPLALRRRPTRLVVQARRHRGVPAVTRQQVLQPGHLRGQLRIGRPQLLMRGAQLPMRRPHLLQRPRQQTVLRDQLRDPGLLLRPIRDQLLAGQINQSGHAQIQTPPGSHPPDRHAASITHRYTQLGKHHDPRLA